MTQARIYVAGHQGMVGYSGRITFDATQPDGLPVVIPAQARIHAVRIAKDIG